MDTHMKLSVEDVGRYGLVGLYINKFTMVHNPVQNPVQNQVEAEFFWRKNKLWLIQFKSGSSTSMEHETSSTLTLLDHILNLKKL